MNAQNTISALSFDQLVEKYSRSLGVAYANYCFAMMGGNGYTHDQLEALKNGEIESRKKFMIEGGIEYFEKMLADAYKESPLSAAYAKTWEDMAADLAAFKGC